MHSEHNKNVLYSSYRLFHKTCDICRKLVLKTPVQIYDFVSLFVSVRRLGDPIEQRFPILLSDLQHASIQNQMS